ncbi:arginyl-tRNA synthetase [Gloeophyllum trabeum ATCC 11539]|uniref:arginine--tRNA ligase n=1 Tax=Gloeophyllum trabeum (strain ATCC 11539 / FP-39264 / Madison 617) TaxID=670483 RepID=S7RZP5_GLOTA|nr:arginyl-tRNA synthetase [Gloeophyllum trabeum ATCC 11539]EPQ60480.1 arginyl-tRNA synthetase [Gloeophyllum trabeum ATCC 11539]
MSSPDLPTIEAADPANFPLDSFKIAIAVVLSNALHLPLSTAFSGVDYGKKGVDFTVAVPRFRLKANPAELIENFTSTFTPNHYLERCIGDAAFLHFYVRTPTLLKLVLDRIHLPPSPSRPSFGSNVQGTGKKVIVEFSSPNIAKPFHAGHLRSTIIGTVLSNISEANGWDVVRMNYLGDWGKQFGLLAVGFERYGSEELLAQNAIMHLFDVYVRVNRDAAHEKESSQQRLTDEKAREVFRKMESGDEATLSLWRRFRELSIKKYQEVYNRLHVRFDVYAGESLVRSERIQAAMAALEAKNLLTDKTSKESDTNWKETKAALKKGVPDSVDDGDEDDASGEAPAKAVDLSQWKLGKPVVQKPDGTTIYIMRDIAGAFQRYEEYKFDKMIYVVGNQQEAHVAQFFRILSLLDAPFADRLEHVSFGKVNGMSTRKGDVKFLEEILDMAKEAMLAQMQQKEDKFQDVEDPDATADQIGMTCVKIQDMRAKRIHSYNFEPQRMTSFEGDTGAYLQYAHVRLRSVERRVAPTVVLPDDLSQINLDLLAEPKAREIVFILGTYPDVVRTALKTYEPSNIVSFSFRLSHAISSAWETLIVMGQERELAQARLFLYTSARDVLASAMRLLSLSPLSRMIYRRPNRDVTVTTALYPEPMSAGHPILPSVLPSAPALQDVETTPEQIAKGVGKVATPADTPIFICAFDECYRLFPNRDRLMAHRKRDHGTEEAGDVITWNE